MARHDEYRRDLSPATRQPHSCWSPRLTPIVFGSPSRLLFWFRLLFGRLSSTREHLEIHPFLRGAKGRDPKKYAEGKLTDPEYSPASRLCSSTPVGRRAPPSPPPLISPPSLAFTSEAVVGSTSVSHAPSPRLRRP